LRVFTMSQLLRYDGRDGRSAYVAVNGIVYDVTTSFLWQRGKHQVLHDCASSKLRPRTNQ
jgi:predicted heme/steroid binding protein